MIQHDERSVVRVDHFAKLKRAADLFTYYIYQDKKNRQVYGARLRQAAASVLTYVSLHLAVAGFLKKDSIVYLFRGIVKNPFEIF